MPFQFCVYSLVIECVRAAGHRPDDITSRREQQPWYPHKDEPAFEDMLAESFRRTLLAARITGVSTAQPDPHKYRDYELACAAAA